MWHPTVIKIVQNFISLNGFDGLYNDELECSCPSDDLSPCGGIKEDCRGGYQVKAPPGDEVDFYILASKDEKPSGKLKL